MDVTAVDERSIVVRELQYWKARSPIVCRPGGRETEVRNLQPLKANSPIVVSAVEERSAEVRPESWKAEPRVCRLDGKLAVASSVQPLKA